MIWDPVPEIERNGRIVRYEVQYNQSTLDEIPLTNVREALTSALLLYFLQEFVEYSVTVKSYNGVGAGPFSPVVNFRTLESSECTCV